MAVVSEWVCIKALCSVGRMLIPCRHSSELPSKEYREKHQAEIQEAQDEIKRLDAEVATIVCYKAEIENLQREKKILEAELAEANQSAEHWKERHDTVDGIRQKLAASLSGRCCGNQITMGNTEAKIVHGSVVVSDPDDGFPHEFAKQVAEVLDKEEAEKKSNRTIVRRGGPFDEKDGRIRHATDD